MNCHPTVELGGKKATGIEVPAVVVEALGMGEKPPAAVTLNRFSYRTTVAVVSGRYLIPLGAENRAGAGAAPATCQRRIEGAVTKLRAGT